jgi:large subunit ribosomal protein L22
LFISKLIRSGVANWSQINSGERIEDSDLYVKSVLVDGGVTMKRLRTAPQGRGYRIRKRSNHITIVIDTISKQESNEVKK